MSFRSRMTTPRHFAILRNIKYAELSPTGENGIVVIRISMYSRVRQVMVRSTIYELDTRRRHPSPERDFGRR